MPSPRRFAPALSLLCSSMLLSASVAAQAPAYDMIIRGGTIYDGSGQPPVVGDVAIKDDRIVAVGKVDGTGRKAKYRRAAWRSRPGFINMLSWANESLIVDPRSQSDIRQGVTLEVMGEGWSMGPLNAGDEGAGNRASGRHQVPDRMDDARRLSRPSSRQRGIATNVASFVGAATVRIHELGEGDVDPTPAQLERMRALVRQAMNEGAMGVGSSLIYAPGSYAETDELVALTQRGRQCGGMYISHMRCEGDRLVEAVDELDRDFAPIGRPRRNLPPQDGGARQLGQTRLGGRARSRRRAPRACGSPPTCTPTPPARPGSMRRCRPGCRRAGSRRGSSG